jgi:hypothetical protein
MAAHQHTLGLLDAAPMFQGVLQLLGQPAAGLRGRQGAKEMPSTPAKACTAVISLSSHRWGRAR